MPYKPGESGNPSGRPSGYNGLAKAIKEHTKNGEEILDLLLKILRGKTEGGATTKERLVAAQMLLDRGWGKAPETVEIIGQPQRKVIDMSSWSVEKLEQVRALKNILKLEPARDVPQPQPQPLPFIDVDSDE